MVKARTGIVTLFALAVLAGAFISLGALFSIVVASGSETRIWSHALTRRLELLPGALCSSWWPVRNSSPGTTSSPWRGRAALSPRSRSCVTGLSFAVAFARGVLCNALVCLAAWLTLGGHSVVDRIAAIVFPVTAFVAVGFEHSIANGYLLPWALALDEHRNLTVASVAANITAVTAGNIVGGTLLVAGVYWVAYLRQRPSG